MKTKITDERILALKPGKTGRLPLSDTVIGGLEIRVSASSKTWSYRYWIAAQKKNERIRIGEYPAISVHAARKLAQRIAVEVANGSSPADTRRAASAEPTLDEVFTRFEAAGLPWDGYGYYYRSHLAHLGKGKVSAVTQSDVKQVVDKAWRAGKHVTGNHILATVAAIYKFADVANPAIKLKKMKIQSRDRHITPSEMPRFIEALRRYPVTVSRDFIWLALLTGARRANICAMRWGEIDTVNKVWRIPMTKNGDPQYVPLTDEAMTIIESRRGLDPVWVLAGRGKTGHIVEPKKALTWALREAGIKENVRIHDLRRTFATWQIAEGTSLYAVGKSLGHRSASATQVYARMQIEPIRASVQRATRRMFGNGNGSDGKAG